MKTEKELLEIAEKVYHQYDENRYPKAIKLFKELLLYYPKNIDGWKQLSTMQCANKNFDDALVSIDEAIKLDPKNIWSIKQKTLLFFSLRKLEYDGSKYFDEDSDGFYWINEFQDRDEILKAYISHLQLQIDTFPEDEDIHELYDKIGDILEELGRYKEAIITYNKVLEIVENSDVDYSEEFLNPFETVNLSISKAYEKINEFKNAMIHLDRAIKYDKENSYLLTHKAKLYDRMGDTENKIKVLNLFLENSEKEYKRTQDKVYLFHKIDTYIDLYDFSNASIELSKIEKLDNKKHYLEAISEYKTKLENLKTIYNNK